MKEHPEGLYIVHISIHGLIRGEDLELGRDADTGGQTKYVVELARTLGNTEGVARVDLLTRQVVDPRVSKDYSVPLEPIGERAWIRRITAGPRRYLRKESLWKYLDMFVDQALLHLRQVNRLPDVIHAHYADAGYVGRTLSALVGCPFVFTGHSLGRVKRERLLESGVSPSQIEERYQIGQRIEAEELTLDAAAMVVTSTRQEVAEQYERYDQYAPDRMRVIPPGVDLTRFFPPRPSDPEPPITASVNRFLRDPNKPMVLALARADERKNLGTLVDAFGQHPELRERANLVVVAGNRDRLSDLGAGARKVWTDLLQRIDAHDLYGSVAYPKHHRSEDVADLYRLAATRRGVFVNAALTEPFGLTLLEAAASGVPVVATHDGGPQDIVGNCHNGILVDPLDAGAIAEAIDSIVRDEKRWEEFSRSGIDCVEKHYSWDAHVRTYLEECRRLIRSHPTRLHELQERGGTTLPLADRMLFCGLQKTLLGDDAALAEFRDLLRSRRPQMGFGIATGLSSEQAFELLDRENLPAPDVLIAQLGGEIFYGRQRLRDRNWERHLRYRWDRNKVVEALQGIDGLELAEEPGLQHEFKVTYRDGRKRRSGATIRRRLRGSGVQAQVILSGGRWVDVLPIRSSKGQAIRYLSFRWGLPQGRIMVVARTGGDAGALQGSTLGVVIKNHGKELDEFKDHPRIFFAKSPGCRGLLEGIDYYGFDQRIHIPEEDVVLEPPAADQP